MTCFRPAHSHTWRHIHEPAATTPRPPARVVFDGSSVWIANNVSNSVTKLRASDGVAQGTFPVGAGPIQMAFDGSNIWVSNLDGNTVTKLRASDGVTLGTFNVSSPHGIAFDGANIWVVSGSVPP